MNNNELDIIAERAGLKITTTGKHLSVKQQLKWRSKLTVGVLLFLCGGIAVGIIPFIKEANIISKVFGVSLGFLLVAGSVLTLIRDVVDGFLIEGRSITIRYNLKRVTIPTSSVLEVKMKTDAISVRTTVTSGSEFLSITHFIRTANKEIPILRFSMDRSDADEALKLGNAIKRTINNYISGLTHSSL